MGFGDFGSNGSVHWQITYDDNKARCPDHADVDTSIKHPGNKDKRCAAIGGGRSKGHPGAFRVVGRYRNHRRALAALQAAMDQLIKTKSSNVVLDVELRPYADVKDRPGSSRRWEVSVGW